MREQAMSATVKTSDWITPEEIPDPKEWPHISGWSILVRPLSIKSKTKGGLLLPGTLQDDVQKSMVVGRVVAMGNTCYKHPDFMGDVMCKVGDFVVYSKLNNIKYMYRGIKVVLVDDRDIRMRLDDPSDIDPNYSLNFM